MPTMAVARHSSVLFNQQQERCGMKTTGKSTIQKLQQTQQQLATKQSPQANQRVLRQILEGKGEPKK
jgi:hypothetical protein